MTEITYTLPFKARIKGTDFEFMVDSIANTGMFTVSACGESVDGRVVVPLKLIEQVISPPENLRISGPESYRNELEIQAVGVAGVYVCTSSILTDKKIDRVLSHDEAVKLRDWLNDWIEYTLKKGNSFS